MLPSPKTAVCMFTLTLVWPVLPGCRHDHPQPGSGGSVAAASAPPAAPPSPQAHVRRSATFRTEAVRLTIEDVHMSTRFDEVLARDSAQLVVNGGFFDPKGEPLGLAVSDGRAVSAFSPTMSGGVLWIRDGVAHLSATEQYEAGAVDFAIQCRPRLVVASQANVRSDDGRRAPRTAICLRDAGQTLEVLVADAVNGDGGPTLFELAQELARAGCEEALNLDGGPSTGWASPADAGGLIFAPPHAPVRHVVVVRDAPR